jgi:transposase-like protein
MKGKRNKYKSEFKAQVALEALRGDKTLAELAQAYGVHPSLINDWKRQLVENAAAVFERGQKPDTDQAQMDGLYKKIGQLEVERDFLASRPGLMSLMRRGGK